MKILSLIIIIILLPSIILTSGILLFSYNLPFYKLLYVKSGTYDNFNSKQEVETTTKELIDYFRGKNRLEQNFFSTQAKLHLHDVKNILNWVRTLFLVSLCGLVVFWRLAGRKEFFKNIRIAIISTISTAFLFLFLVRLNFDFLFWNLHMVTFDNNLWLFEGNDNLIKLFPEPFFIIFSQVLAIYIISFSVILLVITRSIEKND